MTWRLTCLFTLALAFAACGADADQGAAADADGADDTGPAVLLACLGDAECDDGFPCTVDVCTADGVCDHTIQVAAACDDADACTEDDRCGANGICGGTPVALPDDACVVCTCDAVDGVSCSAQLPGVACDDDNCCTSDDRCAGCDPSDPGCNRWGSMCGGSETACDDGLDCTADSCSCALDGTPRCTHDDVADGTACELEANACTEQDTCQSGQCVQGAQLALNDDNPCTRDKCVKGEVVHELLNSGQCDDGDPCTQDDHCSLGACVGGSQVQCEKPDCASSVSCVSGEGCVPIWLPAGATCSDSDPCTTGDACDAAHDCVASATVIDDDDPCTIDACDPMTGQVTHTLTQGTCDDSNPCTFGDICGPTGGCSGTPVVCPSDNDPCTLDQCNPSGGACGVVVPNGTPAPDANLCDGTETCVDGVVTPGSPVSCADDGNPCTTDVCDATDGGCGVARPNGTQVPDDDLCDGVETCVAGAVTDGTPVSCVSDGNPCTNDVCNPVNGGCGVNLPDAAQVPDADLCDGVETCVDGAVTPGPPVTCPNDGNPCIDDVCDPADGGCGVHVEDGTEVPDSDLCDGVETCDAGVVTDGTPVTCASDDNPCTDDVCNAADGTCGVAHPDSRDVADDDPCNGVETCVGGVFTAGWDVTCGDDDNPCTDDVCDESDGSCGVAHPDTHDVADEDPCNGVETCVGGVFTPGSAVTCEDDGSPCTNDICHPISGACGVAYPDTHDVSDGDACNGVETCADGVFKPGISVICTNDLNPCTIDVCDSQTGNCNIPVTNGPQDDGDPCNGDDACVDGVLTHTNAVVCPDDGHPCTSDVCVSATGGCGVLRTSGPGDLTLQPGPSDSADKYIGSVYNSDPSGVNETIRAGGWGDNYWTLLRFELSGLVPGPSAATIWLYPYANISPTQMYLDRVDAAWNLSTSWGNRPATTNLRSVPASTQDQWYPIDVTDVAPGWLDGSTPNWGIQLRPHGTSNNYNQFRSADYVDDPSLRPSLTLTYDCATYPPPCADTADCAALCEGTACNDGDACTGDDTCTDGVCEGVPTSCPEDGCFGDSVVDTVTRDFDGQTTAVGARTLLYDSFWSSGGDLVLHQGSLWFAKSVSNNCLSRWWAVKTTRFTHDGAGGDAPQNVTTTCEAGPANGAIGTRLAAGANTALGMCYIIHHTDNRSYCGRWSPENPGSFVVSGQVGSGQGSTMLGASDDGFAVVYRTRLTNLLSLHRYDGEMTLLDSANMVDDQGAQLTGSVPALAAVGAEWWLLTNPNAGPPFTATIKRYARADGTHLGDIPVPAIGTAATTEPPNASVVVADGVMYAAMGIGAQLYLVAIHPDGTVGATLIHTGVGDMRARLVRGLDGTWHVLAWDIGTTYTISYLRVGCDGVILEGPVAISGESQVLLRGASLDASGGGLWIVESFKYSGNNHHLWTRRLDIP